MSLYSDLKSDFADIWKTSGMLTKFILGFSIFCTSSSLASLSDTIVKWRGFFLDAMQFYKSYITGPIRAVAEKLDLFFSDAEVDGLLIITILITSNIRSITENIEESELLRRMEKFAREHNVVFMATNKVDFASHGVDRSALETITLSKSASILIWVVIAIVFYGLYFYAGSSEFDHGHDTFFGFLVIYCVILLHLFFDYRASSTNCSAGASQKEVREVITAIMRKKLILFVSVPLASVLIVSVSAAVNAGFMKPLS